MTWVDATPYVHLNNAISDIGSNKATLLISKPIDIGPQGPPIPEWITLHFLRGGALIIKPNETVIINGLIEAGNFTIFTGDGNVQINNASQRINQMWFGPDDVAIQKGLKSLPGSWSPPTPAPLGISKLYAIWYFPGGTYRFQTPIILPDRTALIGDGPDHTILISDVVSAFAIETTTRKKNPNVYENLLQGFTLRGDLGPNSTERPQSLSNGGILVGSVRHELRDIYVEGFRSAAVDNSPGDPNADRRPGIEIHGDAVGIRVHNCAVIGCDVGIYINGCPSVRTTTYLSFLHLRENRTHALLIHRGVGIEVSNFTCEANRGQVTVLITDEAAHLGHTVHLRDGWFENNQCGINPNDPQQWNDTREVKVAVAQGASTGPHTLMTNVVAGGAYYPIELIHCSSATFLHCLFVPGTGGQAPVRVGAGTGQTTFIGCVLGRPPDKSSTAVSTTFIGCDIAQLAIDDAADFPTGYSAPSAQRGMHFRLPPGVTITDLTGVDGAEIIVQGPQGQTPGRLSGKFLFSGRDNTLEIPEGMYVRLRKDPRQQGRWTQIGGWAVSEPGTVTVAQNTLSIDARKVWEVPNGINTDITEISGGHNMQEITIIGMQTDGSKITFRSFAGVTGSPRKLMLVRDALIGSGDVLTLLCRREPNNGVETWYEVSRSQ